MERPKPNKINLWWGKIRSKDEAARVIKGSYLLFYGIGFVFLAGGLFSTLDVLPAVRSFDAYLTGIIWTSLAFLLHRFYSRISAMVSVLLSLAIVIIVTVTTQGKGGILAIPITLMLWPSIRSLRATIKWHKGLEHQKVPETID